MRYTCEPVSDGDRRQIFDESDSRKQRWLEMRGFISESGGQWAVDRESGNYLIRVPTYIARGLDCNYFMRFQSSTYALRVRDRFGPQVAIDDAVEDRNLESLRSHITAAFAVLGLLGQKFVPEFVAAWPARALD